MMQSTITIMMHRLILMFLPSY